MYVLAINGSPHKDTGNTALILNPFLEGMREAGADVDLIYTRDLNIAPCNGDMSCWFEHPGECGMKNDDMENILPKIRGAGILIWATPVYYAGITGPLKNLMDRQLPLYAFGEGERGGRKKAVLVSTCGAWGRDMFEPLLAQFRMIYQGADGGSDFAGALLRPHAEALSEMVKAGERQIVDRVFGAARDAGRQMAKEGRMAEETLKEVSRALIPEEAYYKAAMERFQQLQEAKKKEPGCQ